MRVQLRNAGTTPFTLEAATMSLEDSASKRQVVEDIQLAAEPQTIGPGLSREFVFTLPHPVFAANTQERSRSGQRHTRWRCR